MSLSIRASCELIDQKILWILWVWHLFAAHISQTSWAFPTDAMVFPTLGTSGWSNGFLKLTPTTATCADPFVASLFQGLSMWNTSSPSYILVPFLFHCWSLVSLLRRHCRTQLKPKQTITLESRPYETTRQLLYITCSDNSSEAWDDTQLRRLVKLRAPFFASSCHGRFGDWSCMEMLQLVAEHRNVTLDHLISKALNIQKMTSCTYFLYIYFFLTLLIYIYI